MTSGMTPHTGLERLFSACGAAAVLETHIGVVSVLVFVSVVLGVALLQNALMRSDGVATAKQVHTVARGLCTTQCGQHALGLRRATGWNGWWWGCKVHGQ